MDLGLGKDKQESLGEEAGNEIKGVAKSAWNGTDAGFTEFSEECNEGINWSEENILELQFDRPDENGVTYRQIVEKDKQRAIDDVNRLEADVPYKDIFNATKNTVNNGLNIAGLAMAARDLPALAKTGFGWFKDANMLLKSKGFDTKFLDQLLDSVENGSKKVTGKLSKEAEDFLATLKERFGIGSNVGISKLMQDAANKKTLEILASQSKKSAGPCLLVIYDPLTGKIAYGQNFKTTMTGRAEYNKWLENDADPLIRELEAEYKSKIDSGEITLSQYTDDRYAAHSEIVALDDILKNRRELGLTVDRTTISELYLQNIDLTKAYKTGEIVHKSRCENCSYLTDGINTLNHN